MGEPQPELGMGQVHGIGIGGLAGDGVQQRVFPIQQQGALALAFGADVLHQREQPVGSIGARGTLACMGIGQGHAFQRDIHRSAQAADRLEGDGAAGCLPHDALEQALLEHARTTGDQVHRNAHPCMHIADHPLRGHQGRNAVDGGGQQLRQPALHGRFQAQADLVVRQKAAGARVFQQHVIEVMGQVRRRLCGQPGQQCGSVGAGVLQGLLLGIGQRTAGLIQVWNDIHDDCSSCHRGRRTLAAACRANEVTD